MGIGQRLTELEGAVLGVIWSRGPITAYGVRQRFMTSTTRGWSTSTGAIHPAIRRLAGYGFISSTPEPGDGRSSRRLEATSAGEEALQSWILGLEDWMGSAVVDPVRTRVNYLAVLPAPDRRAFIDRAERNARAALADMANYDPDPQARDPKPLAAAHLGAQMDVEARVAWLGKLRDIFDAPE
jgi:DNA-binding PadR family transcriptional regulator